LGILTSILPLWRRTSAARSTFTDSSGFMEILELRGTRKTNVDGEAVPTQGNLYSWYVQLSRCRSLDGIMLLSKARERDFL
jgi:hypothetical protein